MKKDSWTDDEYRLIEEIRNGKTDQYRIIIDRYSPMVFHIVRGFEKDTDEVKELAQQIFVKAFEKLDRFHHESKFSSWLYSISMNHCRDYAKNIRRSNNRFSEMEEGYLDSVMIESSNPQKDLIKKQSIDQLYRGIDKLKEEYSEPLLMKYRDGLSYKVMSDRLGVSVSALKVRVHRAREELKGIVENNRS